MCVRGGGGWGGLGYTLPLNTSPIALSLSLSLSLSHTHTHTHTLSLSLSLSLWVLFMGRGTEDWLGAMRSVAPYHEAGVLVEDGFFGHVAATLRPRSLTVRGQKDSSRSRSERRLEWGRVWRFPGPPVVRRPRSPRTLPPREGPPRVRKSFQPSCLSRQETLALPRLSHGSAL